MKAREPNPAKVDVGPDALGGSETTPSGHWLVVGTLHEAISTFSQQEDLPSFWTEVCRSSRWIIPARRLGVLVAAEEGGPLRVTARMERGEVVLPEGESTDSPFLKRALHNGKPTWVSDPASEMEPAPGIVDWLLLGRPARLLLAPFQARQHEAGLLVFATAALATDDEVMLTPFAGIYALHVGLNFALHENLDELRFARDEADRANRAKSAFLANMSHEIRTPLNGIIGLAHHLLEAELGPREQEYAGLIRSSGKGLLELLSNVLDLSKLEAEQTRLEDVCFDLRKAVAAAVELLAVAAREKGLGLSFEVDPHLPELVFGDSTRLRQVLLNLIGNAVKFTEEGFVEVTARREVPGDSGVAAVRFEVRDSGIGFPEDARAHIFQPFLQADASTTRRFGGTGLGLAIARRLVELMGGEIDCKNLPERGSLFWFRVPLRAAWEPPAGSGTTPGRDDLPEARRHFRVLVAEDNPVNRMVTELHLRKLGYRVSSVSNGLEVLEILRRQEFDLVLMDCQMPELDGYEATRQLLKDATVRCRPPVVATTANALKGDREKCLESGMADYLAKPFTLGDLAAVLDRHLGVCD